MGWALKAPCGIRRAGKRKRPRPGARGRGALARGLGSTNSYAVVAEVVCVGITSFGNQNCPNGVGIGAESRLSIGRWRSVLAFTDSIESAQHQELMVAVIPTNAQGQDERKHASWIEGLLWGIEGCFDRAESRLPMSVTDQRVGVNPGGRAEREWKSESTLACLNGASQ